MKEIKFQVLWIDDRYEESTDVIELAELYKIEFTYARTSEEGLKLYETNLDKWDGVILDGYFFEDSFDGGMNTGAFIESMNGISRLESRRYVPVFIFSAYTQDLKKVVGLKYKIYDKASETVELLNAVVFEAKRLLDTQIKNEYWDIIEAFPEYEEDLIEILTPIQRKDVTKNEVLGKIRSFFDDKDAFIKEFHKIGFSKEIKKLSGLSWHFKFYNENDKDYYGEEIVPIYIQRTFFNLVEKTNKGAHSYKKVKNGKQPYFIRGAVFDFLNILDWFKKLPKDERSKTLYRNLSEEIIRKQIKKDEEQTRKEEQNGEMIEAMINITSDGSCYCIVKNPDMVRAVDQGKFFTINRSQLYEENKEQ